MAAHQAKVIRYSKSEAPRPPSADEADAPKPKRRRKKADAE